MNKKVLKQIDFLARVALEQETFLASWDETEIIGEDVILSGTTEIDGVKVEKDKKYMIKVPCLRDVDHKLRMKKAYKKDGVVGVLAYLKPLVKPEYFERFATAIMKDMPDKRRVVAGK